MSAITATTGKPTGNAARVRMRLLAAFLPVTAVLYIGAEALDPRGTDQVVTNTATALRLLPIASAHSSQLYLSGSLSVLALGELAMKTEQEMLKYRNFGKKSLNEIKEKLEALGLSLCMKFDERLLDAKKEA